jgi:hypothetical protein
LILNSGDGRSQSFTHFFHFFGVRVLLSWPEEASQAVALAPRHNVNVKVRNALAHAVVDSDKSALGAERWFHGAPEQLYDGKDRLHKRFGQILERFNVILGDDEAMAWEQRAMVEKSDTSVILIDDGILVFPLQDGAECAVVFERVLLGHQFWIQAMTGGGAENRHGSLIKA